MVIWYLFSELCGICDCVLGIWEGVLDIWNIAFRIWVGVHQSFTPCGSVAAALRGNGARNEELFISPPSLHILSFPLIPSNVLSIYGDMLRLSKKY